MATLAKLPAIAPSSVATTASAITTPRIMAGKLASPANNTLNIAPQSRGPHPLRRHRSNGRGGFPLETPGDRTRARSTARTLLPPRGPTALHRSLTGVDRPRAELGGDRARPLRAIRDDPPRPTAPSSPPHGG